LWLPRKTFSDDSLLIEKKKKLTFQPRYAAKKTLFFVNKTQSQALHTACKHQEEKRKTD
jgi:hypothetical protein